MNADSRRRRSVLRSTAAAVAVFAAVLLLTGCERSAQSDLDVMLSEGRFVVVNCGDETVAAPVNILVALQHARGEWVAVFDAVGDATFGAGGEFTNDPAEWVEVDVNDVRAPEPGDRIEVTLTSGSQATASYEVPSSGLSEGEWLSHRGGVVPAVCADEQE